REAIHFTEKAGYTKAQLAYYDSFRDRAMKERSALSDAEKEGITIGLAEGRAIGRTEGKAEGLAEGRAKEKETVIINGHEAGFTVAQLSLLTKQTEEKICEILKKNGYM
ncbi:MAG: hypothetical protein LBC47_03120, partial [Tannerella sp.]|nr:hypothetical protein [Tannerella sp.]